MADSLDWLTVAEVAKRYPFSSKYIMSRVKCGDWQDFVASSGRAQMAKLNSRRGLAGCGKPGDSYCTGDHRAGFSRRRPGFKSPWGRHQNTPTDPNMPHGLRISGAAGRVRRRL